MCLGVFVVEIIMTLKIDLYDAICCQICGIDKILFFILVQGAFINYFMQEEGGGTFVPLIKVWAKQPFFMTNGGCVLYKNTQ